MKAAIADPSGKASDYRIEQLSPCCWMLTRLNGRRSPPSFVTRFGRRWRCTCFDNRLKRYRLRYQKNCKHVMFLQAIYPQPEGIPMTAPTQTQPNNCRAVVTRQEMRGELEKSKSQIAMALPRHMHPAKMIRSALTLWNLTPELQKCSAQSVVACVIRAAELGLELSGPLGQAYMIPFAKEATLVVGYRGLLRLAHNTGMVSYLNAHEVCERDLFEYQYGSEDFEVMSVQKIHQHKEQYSKGWKRTDSPWQTAFDEQAKKTVLRRLCKRVPLSPELQFLAAPAPEAEDEPLPSMLQRPASMQLPEPPAETNGSEIPDAETEPSERGGDTIGSTTRAAAEPQANVFEPGGNDIDSARVAGIRRRCDDLEKTEAELLAALGLPNIARVDYLDDKQAARAERYLASCEQLQGAAPADAHPNREGAKS